jgi:hypothetical protein
VTGAYTLTLNRVSNLEMENLMLNHVEVPGRGIIDTRPGMSNPGLSSFERFSSRRVIERPNR